MRTQRSDSLRFLVVALIALSLGAGILHAAEQNALDGGLRAFAAGEHDEAILRLRTILFDHAGSELTPDAHFWIARAAMAAGRLSEAESNLESYLSGYPDHRYFEEAVYHKGRLLFLQGDFQEAIRQFQYFNEKYPRSPYQANVLYWTGESLLELGRLDEAERLFLAVTTHYPTSFRAEAARNRLDVTAALRRERQMAELLQWSHTELLRARNEFSAREQAYELALQRYQGLEDGAAEAELREELDRLLEQIRLLETQISHGSAATEAEATRLRALRIKEQAVEMKERYLEQLIRELEEG